MAARTLTNFEKRLGIPLPEPVKEFLLHPRELANFSVPFVREFTSLEDLWPGIPTRTLPFLNQSNGDAVGLYFPRDGGKPLVVWCFHEGGPLVPITSDVRKFVADPDRFDESHPQNKRRLPKDEPRAWQRLLYNFESERPELELLKPLCLNTKDDGQADKRQFKKLTRKLGATRGKAAIIRRHFKKPRLLLDRHWWFDLSDALAQAHFWTEAIEALENCLIIISLYPYYGDTSGAESHPDWAKTVEVLKRLLPLVKQHGDGLDRITIPHQLKLARAWSMRLEQHSVEAKKRHEEEEDEDESELSWEELVERHTITNKPPRKGFAVNFDPGIHLADILKMSDHALKRITGISDIDRVVKKIPLDQTCHEIGLFELNGVSVALSLEFAESSVPIGAVLRAISLFLRDKYLAYPARYQTGGQRITDVDPVYRLVWTPGDDWWNVSFTPPEE